MTTLDGKIETLSVTELYDGRRTLAYFLDPEEAKDAAGLHGVSGPAQTRLVELEVIWAGGKAYPLGKPVLGGPVASRVTALEGRDWENYNHNLDRGDDPYKALLRILK